MVCKGGQSREFDPRWEHIFYENSFWSHKKYLKQLHYYNVEIDAAAKNWRAQILDWFVGNKDVYSNNILMINIIASCYLQKRNRFVRALASKRMGNLQNRFVRVVKETGLRSVGAILVGSIPTACILNNKCSRFGGFTDIV